MTFAALGVLHLVSAFCASSCGGVGAILRRGARLHNLRVLVRHTMLSHYPMT